MRDIGAYFCYVKNSYKILSKPKATSTFGQCLSQFVIDRCETIDA